ncbi:MAG: hypothetical protein K0S14_779 [Thermomicrobiales bacterium]|jgi:hypothetical protein|nr:hypothetical protein [Thermomicrobiales bacterium]
MRSAESTLCHIEILVYQMEAHDRSTGLLEEYGFTLEQLEAELDEEELRVNGHPETNGPPLAHTAGGALHLS